MESRRKLGYQLYILCYPTSHVFTVLALKKKEDQYTQNFSRNFFVLWTEVYVCGKITLPGEGKEIHFPREGPCTSEKPSHRTSKGKGSEEFSSPCSATWPEALFRAVFVRAQLLQSCPALGLDSWDPKDCSLPDSSVRGILQARILEWIAISFSRGSSWPRDWTQVSRIAGRHFTDWPWIFYRIKMFSQDQAQYRAGLSKYLLNDWTNPFGQLDRLRLREEWFIPDLELESNAQGKYSEKLLVNWYRHYG